AVAPPHPAPPRGPRQPRRDQVLHADREGEEESSDAEDGDRDGEDRPGAVERLHLAVPDGGDRGNRHEQAVEPGAADVAPQPVVTQGPARHHADDERERQDEPDPQRSRAGGVRHWVSRRLRRDYTGPGVGPAGGPSASPPRRSPTLCGGLVMIDGCSGGDDALFDVQKVADGVHVAVAARAYKVNCNTALIETDDGVLVVDSHSKPSAARVVLGRLRQITSKPVRSVVNTHFHWDHWQGNEAYPSAYGHVEVITNDITREAMVRKSLKRIQDHVRQMPAEIEGLRAQL